MMKILQLNVQYFTLEDAIFSFIDAYTPDIVLLQEVGDGLMSRGISAYPLDRIAQELGYHSVHGKSYSIYNEDHQTGSFGVAILSKYPIISHQVMYVPYLGSYRTYSHQQVGLEKRGAEHTWEERLAIWSFEWQTPSPIIDAIIEIHGTTIRVMTTHFKPSPQCTESFQMLKHVEYLQELLSVHSTYPTILGGDFNIGKHAMVLQPLYEDMYHVLDDSVNTLNPRIHPGFQFNIPSSGYHVDHILYKGFISCVAQVINDVDISDHLPILAELELQLD